MNGRRIFEEHVVLFAAYAARVLQLSSASWEGLRVRCADLNDPSFRALLNRAFLAAKPHELWIPPVGAQARASMRAIAAASRIVQTSLAITFEVMAEFEVSASPARDLPLPRTTSTGKPTFDACIDAYFLIEAALIPLERTQPGVVTAVRAAGQALLRHDWLSPEDFRDIYRYVEPEIPFAELDPPRDGP